MFLCTATLAHMLLPVQNYITGSNTLESVAFTVFLCEAVAVLLLHAQQVRISNTNRRVCKGHVRLKECALAQVPCTRSRWCCFCAWGLNFQSLIVQMINLAKGFQLLAQREVLSASTRARVSSKAVHLV